MRVLIAEDDLTSRTVLASILKKIGFDVIMTVNGSEAWLEMQKPDAPSLVILDWMMPEIDGPEVVRLVRALQSDPPPYIIMLTAKDKKSDIILGLESGANDYLAKPFDTGELRARIEVGRRMVEMQDAIFLSREAVQFQATHDHLTGLLNRRAILERLDEERARTFRSRDLLVIGLCDLDHFKRINDTYGHQTGDEVLCDIARSFQTSLRIYDSVGRIGGEEFLVITTVKNELDAKSIFNRLCKRISDTKIATRSGELSVSVSIGMANVSASSSVDLALELADKALYQAKSEGRNRISYNAEYICKS